MDWDLILDVAKVLGLPLTMALVGVWAFATGRVVAKVTHDAIVKDRDEQIDKLERREQQLFDLALSGTRGLEQATTVLKAERRQR